MRAFIQYSQIEGTKTNNVGRIRILWYFRSVQLSAIITPSFLKEYLRLWKGSDPTESSASKDRSTAKIVGNAPLTPWVSIPCINQVTACTSRLLEAGG